MINTGGGGFSGSSGVGGGDSASFGGISFGAIPPMPTGFNQASGPWGVSVGNVLSAVAVVGVVYLIFRGR
ncbi:hypothetical protein [Oceanospirillum maris]|uniref:hypothetical protein n=1 Tax=Oceanospirillum maris TaxID=64977 RepID=UPI0004029DBE|nr:hypothetical protein [Oceanospirillum maris]